MELYEVNNTQQGSLANITCMTGYEPDKVTIRCLNTGVWENATCLMKGSLDFTHASFQSIKI